MSKKYFSLTLVTWSLVLLLRPPLASAQFPWSNVNPGNPPGFKPQFTDLGSVVSAIFPYIFWLAGLASLVYVLWSGFRLMMSEGNPKQIESARSQLMQALVGFLIIFSSYWIVQLMEVIFDVTIL